MGFYRKRAYAGFVILIGIFAIGCFGVSAVYAQETDSGHSISEFDRVDQLETQISALYAQTREIDADVSEQDADKENRILRTMVALYTEIIDRSPQKLSTKLVDTYMGRGAVYSQLGEYEQALNDDNTTLRISPGYAYALSNRGFVYALMGRSDAALSDFEQFLKITEGDPNMTPTLTKMVQNKVQEVRMNVVVTHLVQASIPKIKIFYRWILGGSNNRVKYE